MTDRQHRYIGISEREFKSQELGKGRKVNWIKYELWSLCSNSNFNPFSCLTLTKLFDISVPQFSLQCNMLVPPTQRYCED